VNSSDYAYLSNYGIYTAMALFTVAFIAHAMDVAFSVRNLEEKTKLDFTRTKRIGDLGTIMIVLAFIALFLAVLFRGISAERVPWGNMYEFSITGALAFTGAYLYALWKYKIKWLGLPVSIAVLLTLGTAITILYRPSAPLVPALKSTWLVIHVSAAIISGGVFLLANCIAATYLILDRYESKGGRPVWALKLPALETLDQLSYRLVAFVFPLWTFSVIAGAIWAEAAWGRYWGWDPKETWAFITWVAYAAYLHARVTVGWRGRKAAWLCLFAGSTFLFNYVYINIWGSGKHTYSGL
jgi:cytochrome c-type biogenesis protein CcsB